MAVRLIPQLIFRSPDNERHLPLINDYCWMIGRSEDNDIVLGDRWISRNHAMLQQMGQGEEGEGGEYYLIDLGSRNGTFINGRRVSIPAILRHGDRLMFGQTEVEFSNPDHQQLTGNAAKAQQDHTATATLHMRRLISVLVVDIRNFTVLTRQMDEGTLSELIGNWFRRAGQIIQRYGSWVDKYIGDAVMAVWIHGSQHIEEAEVLQIFQALNELHQMTEELQTQFSLPFPLKFGAGINTGYAMVGNAGSGDRPDYTALGDTVNAVFRLESSTKELKTDIALGLETYRYVTKYFPSYAETFDENEVSLKGYDQPTLAYVCSFETLNRTLQHVQGSAGVSLASLEVE